MGKWVGEKFKSNFAIGDPEWWGKTLAYSRPLIILAIILGIYVGVRGLFGSKNGSTKTSIGYVEKGATVNINPSQQLKQGIYGELSSRDFGIGVFKEVMPNLDISIGIEKSFDDEEVEANVQTRFKF